MGSGASATPTAAATQAELKVGDTIQVPSKGSAKIVKMTTTDVQLQFKDGNQNWYDMEEVSLMQPLSTPTFKVGDSVHVPGKGKVAVISSTTTDVQVQFEDGSSVWHEVEELTKLLQQSISHELRVGDKIQFPGKGTASVVETTTTDLMLQFSDGSKQGFDVEDLKELLDKALEALVGGLKVGSSVKVPSRGVAKVVEMNTTDVQLQFEDGSKKWYDMEDLEIMLRIFSSGFQKGDKLEFPVKGTATVIESTTTEVQLKWSDGTEEWCDAEDIEDMLSKSISHDLRPGDTVQLPGDEEAKIIERTTTDVQVEMRDGSKKTYDIEDFDELLSKKAVAGGES